MNYIVLASDGTRYGPVDWNGLKQWVTEGRIAPDTILEEMESGRTVAAASIGGLFDYDRSTNASSQSHGGVQHPAPGHSYSPYMRPPAPGGGGMRPTPGPQMTHDAGSGAATAGWICAVISLCAAFAGCCCAPVSLLGLIVAIIGIVQGNEAKKVGHPSGTPIIVLNVVALLACLGFVVVTAAFFAMSL